MSALVKEIKVERTTTYKPDLVQLRALKSAIALLMGPSFTGHIEIDCSCGGIGEIKSRGASEKINPPFENPLTSLSTSVIDCSGTS